MASLSSDFFNILYTAIYSIYNNVILKVLVNYYAFGERKYELYAHRKKDYYYYFKVIAGDGMGITIKTRCRQCGYEFQNYKRYNDFTKSWELDVEICKKCGHKVELNNKKDTKVAV